MSKEEAKKYASTEHEGLPEKKKGKKKKKGEKVNEEAVCPKCGKCPCECDDRAKRTYRELLKNKMRSMGVRNPILLDMPEDEKVMKIMTSSSAKMDEMADPSFEIKPSRGAGALTPAAAKQLGPKAVELQKKKAEGVSLPKLKGV